MDKVRSLMTSYHLKNAAWVYGGARIECIVEWTKEEVEAFNRHEKGLT